jgi:predicted nucleotidyltransferase
MSEIKFTKVEKVDKELLKEIVERIVNAVNPLKIILFGSYAYGMPKKGSDLDILVVVDNIKDLKRELRLKIHLTKILLFSHKYPPEKIISKYGTARNKFETTRRNKANNRCSF